MTLTDEMKAEIARFMGWVDTGKPHPDLIRQGNRYEHPNMISFCWVSNFHYDTDWNWIMPVYRKVKATYEKHYDRLCEEPELAPIRMWFRIYFHYGQAHSTPLPLSLALYDIIKFFNDNNIKAE